MAKGSKKPEWDLDGLWPMAVAFAGLLDSNNRIANVGREHEISLRVAKVGEESGEAISARLVQLAQNPGKGKGTQRAVLDELADCVFTSLVAMHSMTGDVEASNEVIREKVTNSIRKKRRVIDEMLKARLEAEGK